MRLDDYHQCRLPGLLFHCDCSVLQVEMRSNSSVSGTDPGEPGYEFSNPGALLYDSLQAYVVGKTACQWSVC